MTFRGYPRSLALVLFFAAFLLRDLDKKPRKSSYDNDTYDKCRDSRMFLDKLHGKKEYREHEKYHDSPLHQLDSFISVRRPCTEPSEPHTEPSKEKEERENEHEAYHDVEEPRNLREHLSRRGPRNEENSKRKDSPHTSRQKRGNFPEDP